MSAIDDVCGCGEWSCVQCHGTDAVTGSTKNAHIDGSPPSKDETLRAPAATTSPTVEGTKVTLDVVGDRLAQLALCAYVRASRWVLTPEADDSPPAIKAMSQLLRAHMEEWILVACDGQRQLYVAHQGTLLLDDQISTEGGHWFVRAYLKDDGLAPGLWLFVGSLYWHQVGYEYPEYDLAVDGTYRRPTFEDLGVMEVDPGEWQAQAWDGESASTETTDGQPFDIEACRAAVAAWEREEEKAFDRVVGLL